MKTLIIFCMFISLLVRATPPAALLSDEQESFFPLHPDSIGTCAIIYSDTQLPAFDNACRFPCDVYEYPHLAAGRALTLMHTYDTLIFVLTSLRPEHHKILDHALRIGKLCLAIIIAPKQELPELFQKLPFLVVSDTSDETLSRAACALTYLPSQTE